jgi:beta-glucosidase
VIAPFEDVRIDVEICDGDGEDLPRSPYPGVPTYASADPAGESTDLGWPITPDGLTRFLRRLRVEFAGLPPIFITENGAAYDDPIVDGSCQDGRRIAYRMRG